MIQSLSIVVPNKQCMNNCKFCVSKMHPNDYKNQMDENLPFFDLYFKDYMKRLEYAKEAGVETVMLTGNSEPQQNRKFLMFFGLMMQMMDSPFHRIETQTTGVGIDRNYLRFLRNHVGVNTISLSISSFDDFTNNQIIGTPGSKSEIDYIKEDMFIHLSKLCENIKEYDFNLRLSVNLNVYNFLKFPVCPEDYFKRAKDLHADQLTFRVLYASDSGTPEDNWVKENNIDSSFLASLSKYVVENGRELEKLPYGQRRYFIDNLSVVIDNDCMNTESKEDLKYLILQPDCHLYSKWDDKASLVF